MKTEAKNNSDPSKFDWPLAYEAEELLSKFIENFLKYNSFSRRLAERMRDETGTDFYEWVDNFALDPSHEAELQNVGFTEESVEKPPGVKVLYHPKAIMPRILLKKDGGANGIPATLAIRPEFLTDFLSHHDLASPIEGNFGSQLRSAVISEENGTRLEAVERLGGRSNMVVKPVDDAFSCKVMKARELWRTRKRNFSDDADGVKHAFAVQKAVIDLVGVDIACELFFAEERIYWEFKNRAARVQKRRQDKLGLGWANHDHHTFRCSRPFFTDLVQFLVNLGFQKRERYYAGAEAGWGAQVMEQSRVGIVVFADVDLMPEEVEIDFSTQKLPQAKKLGTVGLWCALHGDSLLQAGMHHLEARFDFARLRDQLATEGVNTMKPFSDFPFLKQAFTEGERWPVGRERLERLLNANLITQEQFDNFSKNGAIGSHLENLQRKGGFKGFNQKSVSVIISATDPRKVQELANA
jgi:hypothetical protein